MNQSFLQGAIVALVLALVTAVGTSLLPTLGFTWHNTLLILSTLVTWLYFAHQASHTTRKTGRLTMGAAAVVLFVCQFFLDMPLTGVVITNLIFLWVARTWLFLRTPLQSLADFGLWVAGLASAVFIVENTGSFALAVWGLFLIVALWPSLARRLSGWMRGEATANPNFEHDAVLQRLRAANQNADGALRNSL